MMCVHTDNTLPNLRMQGKKGKGKAVPLQWARGFQEVWVPRFHDNGTGWW